MSDSDYISEQEFLDYIKSNADIGDDATQLVISAASRCVEEYCGGRRFYTTTETRYVSADPYQGWVLDLDADLANTTDLEVLIDSANDGTYATTWTLGTQFAAVPAVIENGVVAPYSQLRTIGYEFWPARVNAWYPETVKITGNFGWTEVPATVKLATKLLAAQLYKLADAPLGVAGFGEFGPIRVRAEIPQVAMLLDPFSRSGGIWVSR